MDPGFQQTRDGAAPAADSYPDSARTSIEALGAPRAVFGAKPIMPKGVVREFLALENFLGRLGVFVRRQARRPVLLSGLEIGFVFHLLLC